MRPVETSTFRLSLFAALLFAASGLAVLTFVYVDVMRVIDGEVAAALGRETADLSAIHQSSARPPWPGR